MNAEIWQLINILGAPVIGGIIIWIWKLDSRIFEIRAALIGRDEFRNQMQEIRNEIAELRRILIGRENIENNRH